MALSNLHSCPITVQRCGSARTNSANAITNACNRLYHQNAARLLQASHEESNNSVDNKSNSVSVPIITGVIQHRDQLKFLFNNFGKLRITDRSELTDSGKDVSVDDIVQKWSADSNIVVQVRV